MDIVVFGAGSLGSLIGGLLAREHSVTLVGRDPHVTAVRESGLAIEGCLETTVYPAAYTTVPEAADLAVVTVKSFDTETAGALAGCALDSVLSLQNGLGNEAVLAEQLDGVCVLAGTCTYGAMRAEPGSVTFTGAGEIVLGDPDGGHSERAECIGTAFEEAGLDVTISDDMPWRLWEKLAVNAGINATTALARIENGVLSSGPASETARTAARETAHAARCEGVDLRDDQAIEAIERVIDATAENTSSMLQDVLAGRRTEIDSINGYIARYEGTPVNTTLAQLVRAWEQKHGVR